MQKSKSSKDEWGSGDRAVRRSDSSGGSSWWVTEGTSMGRGSAFGKVPEMPRVEREVLSLSQHHLHGDLISGNDRPRAVGFA